MSLDRKKLALHIIGMGAADVVDKRFASLGLPASAAASVRKLSVSAVLLQPAACVGLGVTDRNAAVAAAKLTRTIADIARAHGSDSGEQDAKHQDKADQRMTHCY